MRISPRINPPIANLSAHLTVALMGSRYGAALVSYQIEVPHVVAPTVTVTRRRPRPSSSS